MRKLLALLLVTGTVVSCGELRQNFGRQKGQTTLTFNLGHESHNPLSTVYPLYGGVILIIKSSGTDEYMRSVFVKDETQPVQLAVPNGTYNAGAVGWEGNASPPCTPGGTCHWAEGQSKCGIAFNDTPFALTGQSFTIPLTMNSTVCQQGYSGNSSPFSDVAYNPVGDTQFPSVNFQFASPYTSGSFRFAVYLNTGVMAQGNFTRTGQNMLVCLPLTSGSASSSLRLPVGKTGDSIFSYTITVHSSGDTSCTGAPLNTIEFPKGFVSPPTSGPYTTSNITYTGNVNTLHLTP